MAGWGRKLACCGAALLAGCGARQLACWAAKLACCGACQLAEAPAAAAPPQTAGRWWAGRPATWYCWLPRQQTKLRRRHRGMLLPPPPPPLRSALRCGGRTSLSRSAGKQRSAGPAGTRCQGPPRRRHRTCRCLLRCRPSTRHPAPRRLSRCRLAGRCRSPCKNPVAPGQQVHAPVQRAPPAQRAILSHPSHTQSPEGPWDRGTAPPGNP